MTNNIKRFLLCILVIPTTFKTKFNTFGKSVLFSTWKFNQAQQNPFTATTLSTGWNGSTITLNSIPKYNINSTNFEHHSVVCSRFSRARRHLTNSCKEYLVRRNNQDSYLIVAIFWEMALTADCRCSALSNTQMENGKNISQSPSQSEWHKSIWSTDDNDNTNELLILIPCFEKRWRWLTIRDFYQFIDITTFIFIRILIFIIHWNF